MSIIRITSKREGFRRCGIPHTEKPTDYTEGTFTAEELLKLREEPMLKVEIIEKKDEKQGGVKNE